MKIAGLISRFENGEVRSDNKASSDQKIPHPGDQGEQSQQDCADRVKGTPTATSPGRLKIKNAVQNLRSPKTYCIHRTDAAYKAVDNQTSDDVNSSLAQPSRTLSIGEKKDTSGEIIVLTITNGVNDEQNKREFLITEHSNRTLVIDNKRKKSQSSTLPDTPWSSRNLGGTSNASFSASCTQASNGEHEGRDVTSRNHQHDTEYGTLALKDEDPDATETNDDEESLPPEVIAMSAASDNSKTKTKAKSLPSLLKTYSFSEVGKKKESSRKLRNSSSRLVTGNGNSDHQPSSRRRLSPGLLKRRGSNEKAESKQRDISVEPREIDVSGSLQPPTRSFSAGNLANAKLKAQNFRERTARSQSPGDQKSTERQPRPGQKKSERNLLVKDNEKRSLVSTISRNSNESDGINESPGQRRPPRRFRGRSPGNLVERVGSVISEGEDSLVEDPSKRPSLVRVESRGCSPGTIRRSINMTGEVSRSQSPGQLNRERHNQLSAKSPGTLRKMSSGGRTRSPGILSSLNKSSGHSNGSRSQSPSSIQVTQDPSKQESVRRSGQNIHPRSPATLGRKTDRSRSPVGSRDITFDPSPMPERGGVLSVNPSTPLKVPARSGWSEIAMSNKLLSTSSRVDKTNESGSPKVDNISTKNLSVPRAKSPGALARRPAKNPRTTQTKKAQSLFEKKSPISIHPSPKRGLSRDDGLMRDGDRRASFHSFQELE
jgi:hypothetical protein